MISLQLLSLSFGIIVPCLLPILPSIKLVIVLTLFAIILQLKRLLRTDFFSPVILRLDRRISKNQAVSQKDCPVKPGNDTQFLDLNSPLKYRSEITKLLLCFFFGVIWSLLAIHLASSWSLASRLENKSVEITGYVTSLPKTHDHCLSFTFRVCSLNDKTINTKIKLNWYQNYPQLKVGDKWNLVVKLKRPHGYMNPGDFDYEKYLFLHHIRALGYVVKSTENKNIDSSLRHYPIQRARQYLANQIIDLTHNEHLAGIIIGLLIGSRNYLTQNEWNIFRDSGTSHLLAIAGLHVGIIFALFYLLSKFIWQRSYNWCQLVPARSVAILCALLFSFGYALISGFSLPTRRAIIMLTTFAFVSLLRRNVSAWSGMLLALVIVLLIEPLAPLDSGFWLSFSAVSILIFALSGRVHANNLWWKYGRAQYVILVGLAPITLLAFGQLSLVAFIANMIAIPWVCFLIMPLSLCSLFALIFSKSLAGYILSLTLTALDILWKALTWLTQFHSVVWYHSIFSVWILLAAIVGVTLLLSPKGLPAKYLGLCFLLPICFYSPPRPKKGEIWFTLLDVGQGLASVIRTQNHTVIYDTGPKFSANFDTGAAVVVPYLRFWGINKIDMLIVSHGDNDHIGGAQSIISMLKVQQIRTSVPSRFTNENAHYCHANEHWNYDGVSFEFLNPMQIKPYLGNNSSCVLRVSTGKNSLLLTGDIEKPAESEIAKIYHSKIAANIIVAPHHGSETSSSWKFISLVKPEFALFPVGYLNRFHFPSKVVIKRYRQLSAKPFATDTDGSITFFITANAKIASPSLYRLYHRHFWNS